MMPDVSRRSATGRAGAPVGQTEFDIAANRTVRNWSRGEQAGRVLWALVRPLFALSPRPAWGFRRALLRLFGARIGRETHVHPSARFTIPLARRRSAITPPWVIAPISTRSARSGSATG